MAARKDVNSDAVAFGLLVVTALCWAGNHGTGRFMAVDSTGQAFTSTSGSPLVWSGGGSGLSQPATVVRYIPSVTAFSNGWMVFDAAGNQRIAK